MNANRRASLPGADELFRSTASPPGEHDPPRPPAPDAPGSTRVATREVDARVLTELVDLASEEDEVQAGARGRLGPGAPSPAVGSLLSWLAASVDARHIVEVGGSAGLIGLWLLRGMEAGGMLTTIADHEQVHALGRSALEEAGAGDRSRAILGDPNEVLSRLSDGTYDLVVWSASADRPKDIRDHAVRLLRGGGVLAVLDVARDTSTEVRGRRVLVRELIEDPRWSVTVLPIDGGVALARRG